jgi:signal peptidase I
MKRALALIIITAACVAGFLSIRGVMPFMAVYGTSMEPELQAGDLILIEEIDTAEVKVGDIIVFTIPAAVREYYNYPSVVAHRVLKIREIEGTGGITFRTKGDNTGEDPFTVRPQDIRGQVSQQIPYLGLPFLFFQSQQGLIFIIISLSLLALYLYAGEIGQGRQWAHQVIFAPVIRENQRTNQLMEQRLESTEKGMEFTQQALNNFASAMAEYAKHLQSHTSAIQGLSEASHELKKGAAEQNQVLARLLENIERSGPKPQPAEPAPEIKEDRYPPGCFRSRRGKGREET